MRAEKKSDLRANATPLLLTTSIWYMLAECEIFGTSSVCFRAEMKMIYVRRTFNATFYDTAAQHCVSVRAQEARQCEN